MKEKKFLTSLIAGLVVVIFGICSVLLDIFLLNTKQNLWISIGCSLIASGLVIVLTELFVDRVKENPLDVWGIKRIYQSRSKMNDDCDISLKKAKYKVDAVAFGLKSFRTEQDKLARDLLRRGVNFRIITMDPDSPFIAQREKEEKENEGQIKNTIIQLIQWADNLNRQGNKGKIIIKGYSCMTLDFYWRVDDDIYIGPYWYGLGSQQTISYKYTEGSGFDMYSDYFDRLWNDQELLTTLTEVKESKSKTK